MEPTSAQLKQKALGFTQSIERMSENMAGRNPSAEFGEDYNRLRDMVEKVHPELAAVLPPKVDILRNPQIGRFTKQRYNEISTYCQQITNLLPG